MSQRRTFWGHLPRDIRESDIEREARHYGRITHLRLVTGFAFVEFSDEREARDCVVDMDGRRILGERVVVEYAKSGAGREPRERREPAPRTNIHVRFHRLPPGLRWVELKELVRPYAAPLYADASPDGTGVVHFATREEADAVVAQLDGREQDGDVLACELVLTEGDPMADAPRGPRYRQGGSVLDDDGLAGRRDDRRRDGRDSRDGREMMRGGRDLDRRMGGRSDDRMGGGGRYDDRDRDRSRMDRGRDPYRDLGRGRDGGRRVDRYGDRRRYDDDRGYDDRMDRGRDRSPDRGADRGRDRSRERDRGRDRDDDRSDRGAYEAPPARRGGRSRSRSRSRSPPSPLAASIADAAVAAPPSPPRAGEGHDGHSRSHDHGSTSPLDARDARAPAV
ncbi:hypothetical protein CXG81DRAFT_17150 [Caulochytrium protostelioides]|uniref:RRM domain-containing protein n=1 Tax=Caulochytrium protostelioides TaxID=1555241 RepID=A0A4P9XCV3_9FUNG|nr:hypothetical protein CXG81DRAFT_17150 [Caulochytrium protostelioides]|eukprot:RKP03297.1 hypothetical protein CXG81DRAFT_17150 [Caulochytrium protostelioides]